LSMNPDPETLLLADEVLYDNRPPWPSIAPGSGASLQRQLPMEWGDDAQGWQAAVASPGYVESTLGDLNGDGLVDLSDVDLLSVGIRTGDPQFDLDADGQTGPGDLSYLVETILNSRRGDANLDGIFNSADLVKVFVGGEYEDEIAGNSTWSEGDWNADGDFNSQDFVSAFSAGPYSLASTPAVPRPYRILSADDLASKRTESPSNASAPDNGSPSPRGSRSAAPAIELVARDLLFDDLSRWDEDPSDNGHARRGAHDPGVTHKSSDYWRGEWGIGEPPLEELDNVAVHRGKR